MKFGKIEDGGNINPTLPQDHPLTKEWLVADKNEPIKCYVGCAKWGRKDLQGFYPRGTKDELAYYASHFNSIELNASYYRIFPREQFEKWASKVPDGFKFFPKIYQGVSHWKRLKGAESYVEEIVYAIDGLGSHLGTVFLQMPENFRPSLENRERLYQFVKAWPSEIPLAVEVRHRDWFADEQIALDYFTLLREFKMSAIITDTLGRRDLIHMLPTTNNVFIRFVGGNFDSDFTRAEEWARRIVDWYDMGLTECQFFVHQHVEMEAVKLAHTFLDKLNEVGQYDFPVPQTEYGFFG